MKGSVWAEDRPPNLLSYALGRRVDYQDMPTVRHIVRQAAQNDYRFTSIVAGIVTSDAFRKRQSPSPTPTPVAATHSSAGGLQ
jgi:hypothetical protein